MPWQRGETPVVTGVAGLTSSNTAIIPAPGEDKRIVVLQLVLQNEDNADTTIYWKSGVNIKGHVLCPVRGDGVALTYGSGNELRLGVNEAFNLSASTPTTGGYSLAYFVEQA